MHCGAGHDTPLTLISGADQRLVTLMRMVAGAGLMAIVLADSYAVLKIVLCTLLLSIWRWSELRVKREPGTRLVVLFDGRAMLGVANAHLKPRFWISRWYCVLVCESPVGTENVLISASRQAPGEYRKLLGWLRLGIRADMQT